MVCTVPGLVEIGPVRLEKKILKFVNVNFLFRDYMYLLLKKDVALHLISPKYALCQVWFEIGPAVLEKLKNVKSLRTDGRTDGRTTGDKKNSIEI